jgi:hypothetical protein
VRLAHGWKLLDRFGLPAETVREFLRAPVRAVPPALAAKIGACRIEVLPLLDPPDLASRWTTAPGSLEIQLACEGIEPHDVALEMLISIGECAWERCAPAGREGWLRLLEAELAAGVAGEIDQETFELKSALLASRAAAADLALIERYAAAAYAATLAEYVHCLWHDVTVRSGPEHLDPAVLRRRLELFARWFPPGRGRRLFG